MISFSSFDPNPPYLKAIQLVESPFFIVLFPVLDRDFLETGLLFFPFVLFGAVLRFSFLASLSC